MTTFVTVIAAAAVAFPLVVLALRGTRADLVRGRSGRHPGHRPDARDLGLPDPRDTDAVRAARDLEAAAAHRATPSPVDGLSPVERFLAGPSAASGPIGTPGRSIHLTGASSGTKPNLA